MRLLTIAILFLFTTPSFSGEKKVIAENEIISTSEKIANSFFKAHQVSNAKISPDGKNIAVMQESGSLSQLILLNTNTFKKNIILSDKFDDSIDIVDFNWIDNASIVLDLQVKGKGSVLLLSKLLFNESQLSSIKNEYLLNDVFLVNPLPNVKDKLIVGRWGDNKTSLYKLDVSNKSMPKQLQSKYKLNKRSPDSTHWLTDSNGNVIVGYGFEESVLKNRVWIKDLERKKWDLVWEGEEKTTFRPVLVSNENKVMFVISNENSDLTALYEYDVVGKKYIEKIYGNENVDISSAIVSLEQESILGVSYVEDGFVKNTYFTELDGIIDSAIKDAIEESKPYIIDLSQDKKIAIVETSSSTDPGTYHLYKADSMELIKFSSKAPWLKEYNLGVSKVVKSKSTDGQYIESYLTLPNTKGTAIPPLIVLPHGGPISVRDTRHFNSHVQFLVALGYAVLQPNYRGSSGFGKKFKSKGMQQWGRLIEDDIQSGMKEVIQQGLVDPNKVCIYGISYGGYSALISAINRPDIFKCAASYAGVTDLPLLFNNIKLAESSRLNDLLKAIVGDPETEMATLVDYSPVYQSERISIPIFLAHGDNDNVVDIEHYYRMKKLLDVYGKPYEDMLLKGEGHSFRYLNNIVSFYVKLDSFFRRSLDLEPL
jgi:dipeptidyl aminopeptidase/acylaminoacyl peptidase